MAVLDNYLIKVAVLDDYLIQVAVLGANSPEWFSCAVGAVMAGGVVSRHNHHHTICHLHHHCHIYHDDHDWSPRQTQQRSTDSPTSCSTTAETQHGVFQLCLSTIMPSLITIIVASLSLSYLSSS